MSSDKSIKDARQKIERNIRALKGWIEDPECAQLVPEGVDLIKSQFAANPQLKGTNLWREFQNLLSNPSPQPQPEDVPQARPSPPEESRIYWGVPKNALIRAVFDKERFYFVRTYRDMDSHSGPAVIVEWHFDNQSRITGVEFQDFSTRRRYKVVGQEEGYHVSDSNPQSTAKFRYTASPLLRHIDVGLACNILRQQSPSLIRFGHGVAKQITSALDEGTMRNSNRLARGEKQLAEIVKDPSAMYLLKLATEMPKFSFQESDVQFSTYYPIRQD